MLRKRIFSLVLVALMLVSIFPMTALAGEGEPAPTEDVTVVETTGDGEQGEDPTLPGDQETDPAGAEDAAVPEETADATDPAEEPEEDAADAELAADAAMEAVEPLALTVSYGDIQCGVPTVFTLTATGGYGNYKYRIFSLEDEYYTVYDESYGNNSAYQTDNTWSFTFYASGTYTIRFSVFDSDENNKNASTANSAYITLNVQDEDYPSVADIVDGIVAGCKDLATDYAKVLYAHDWIISHAKYDNSYSYCSPEGVLARGTGTCESYHRALVLICNKLGIQTGRMTGGGHVWTAVKMDGDWYQVDATWDDPGYASIYGVDASHVYFGLTDDLMALDHTHSAVSGYESTALSDNYFIKSGKITTWSDPVKEEVQEKLDAGETGFTIAVPETIVTEKIRTLIYTLVAYQLTSNETFTACGNAATLTASYTEDGIVCTAEVDAEDLIAYGICGADENGANLTWKLGTDGLLSITGQGEMADYASSEQNAPWYAYRNSITAISIGDEVTSIGEYAFYQCTLLTSVVVPDNIESIGKGAFGGCSGLTKITLPFVGIDRTNTNTSYSTFGYIFGYPATITSYNSSVPDGLETVILTDATQLSQYAFRSCKKLHNVVINNGVTSIGDYAFDGCISLETVAFPVEALNNYSFANTSGLTTVTIQGNGAIPDYNAVSSSPANYQNSPWGWNKTTVTNIILGNGITRIGEYAFYRSSALTTLELYPSVTSVGAYAFEGATALETVRFYGTEAEWNALLETAETAGGNNPLLNATVTYVCEEHEHQWVESDRTDATCTTDGSISYACTVTNCKETKQEVLTKLGHSYDAGTVKKPATCKETGTFVYTCTRVGCGNTKEEELAIIPHTVVTDLAVPATCTEDGLSEGSHCSACGDILVAQQVLPATGHVVVEVKDKAATYFENGAEAGTYCSVCLASLSGGAILPMLVMAAPTVKASGTTAVKLSWKKVSGAKGYEIWRAYEMDGEYTLVKTITSGSTVSYTDSKLKPGTKYYYSIRPYQMDGKTKVYGERSETAELALPLATPTLTVKRSGTKVTLSWKKVTGAEKYYVLRDSGDGMKRLAEADSATLKVTDTVDARGYYAYQLMAVSEDGVVSLSKEVTTTGTSKAPKLTVSVNALRIMTVSWNAVAGAKEYKVVVRSSGGGIARRTIDAEKDPSRSVTLTVSPLDSYTVTVQATLENGDTLTVGAPAKKSVSTSMKAPTVTLKKTAIDQVKVSWKKVTGASGYEILRATGKSGTYETVGTVTGETLSYTDTVAPGKTYYYKVKAVCKDGEGELTDVGTMPAGKVSGVKNIKLAFATPAVTAKLGSVGTADYETGVVSFHRAVKLSWKAVSGATGYEVYRSTAKNGTYELVDTVAAPACTDEGVEIGKTYYYKVRAIRTADSYTMVKGSFSSVRYLKVK